MGRSHWARSAICCSCLANDADIQFGPGNLFTVSGISFALVGGIIGALTPKKTTIQSPSEQFSYRPSLNLGITQNGVGLIVRLY